MVAYIVLGIIVIGVILQRKFLAMGSNLDMNAKVQLFAQAIAVAEGYYVPGSIPSARNNPGNLKVDGVTITTFSTAAEGWQALYRQVMKMFTGESRYYNPTMTIAQIAKTYTGEAQFMNWARNVSSVIGATPDSTLLQYLAA